MGSGYLPIDKFLDKVLENTNTYIDKNSASISIIEMLDIMVETFDSIKNDNDATVMLICKSDKEEKPKKKNRADLNVKSYRNLAFGVGLDEAKASMMIKRWEIEQSYLAAKTAYYDALSNLETENHQFGFDLSLAE